MAKDSVKKSKNTANKSLKVNEKYNLDNEIVIGLNTNYIKPETIKKEKKDSAKKIGISSKIIKVLSLLFLIVIAVLLIFMSPLFTLNQIEVVGNNKLVTSECIEMSGLEIGQNIYKLSKSKIRENIKQNAYVDEVIITRKLPDKIEIKIKEREAMFMLELEDNVYAYINNQGYILEKETSKIEAVTITGFSTELENINVGSRLNNEDLKKLDTVLKIIEVAKNNDIFKLISKIDISDKNNYRLILDSERKIAYIGDASNINTRILYIKAILEKEKDKEGEIFINGNVNIDKAFFREKI